MSQKRAKRLYQFIYINLIRPIMPMAFEGKRYFFMFTNNNMRIIETYIGKQKSK